MSQIVDVLAGLAAIVILFILGAILCVALTKLKNYIKDKIRKLKIKQYAVTYLIDPKINYIDNKNDDDIKVLSFSTYQKSIRTEYFKARSKHAAIAKFYSNSNYRIRNYGDVLVAGVEEITFVT